jgi:uncharacterized tellurite resistance protein B-like protein
MFERLKLVLAGEHTSKAAEVEEEKRIQVATAVILLEVAYADEECSESELEHIIDILTSTFDLDEESVNELILVAEEQLRKSIDIWHFTEIINNEYSDEEKYRIIENVWRVVYADGKLDKYEDYIVHKLARILHIPHKRMIDAKLKFLPDEQEGNSP